MARFGVRNRLTIDAQIAEMNACHHSLRVVTRNHRRIIARSLIGNIVEIYILHAVAGNGIIFRVMKDPYIEEPSQLERLDSYIVEGYVPYRILISGIDGQTAPITVLGLMMLQDIDIVEGNIFDGIPAPLMVAMNAYHNGMSYVCPQNRAIHPYVRRIALKCAAAGINGDAIVGGAQKHVLDKDITTGHHINAVAPPSRAERLEAANANVLRLAQMNAVVGRIDGDDVLDRNVAGIIDLHGPPIGGLLDVPQVNNPLPRIWTFST